MDTSTGCRHGIPRPRRRLASIDLERPADFSRRSVADEAAGRPEGGRPPLPSQLSDHRLRPTGRLGLNAQATHAVTAITSTPTTIWVHWATTLAVNPTNQGDTISQIPKATLVHSCHSASRIVSAPTTMAIAKAVSHAVRAGPPSL